MSAALRSAALFRGSRRPSWASRIASFTSLSRDDDALLAGLKTQRQRAGLIDRSCAEAASVIVMGWCGRIHQLRDGRRQIVELLLPGDTFGLPTAPAASERLRVEALTSVILADATPIARAMRLRTPAHVRLSEACERAAYADQGNLINQVTRLGQRTAYERVAHLLLELNFRLEAVGLSYRNAFELPVRQPDLASIVGLSAVHLNRVLRSLNKDRLIQTHNRTVVLLDIDKLKHIADFDELGKPDAPATQSHF